MKKNIFLPYYLWILVIGITGQVEAQSPGGVSGLNIWFKAGTETQDGSNTAVTTDGQIVGRWRNIVTADVTGFQKWVDQDTGNPIYRTNQINFNPAIEFDGSSHMRSVNGSGWNNNTNGIGTNATPYSYFAVFYPRDNGEQGPLMWGRNSAGGSANRVLCLSPMVDVGSGYGLPSGIDVSSRHYVPNGDNPIEQTPMLLGMRNTSGAGNLTAYNMFLQGEEIIRTGGSTVWGILTGNNSSNALHLGTGGATRANTGDFGIPGHQLNGYIAEIILEPSDIGDNAVQKVNSYLALKYGITLNQRINNDYIASDDSDMWKNDNDGYEFDIFGIGKDMASDFEQKVSTSTEPDGILVVSLDSNFTSSNADPLRTKAFSNDLSFVTFANNNSGSGGNDDISWSNNPAEVNKCICPEAFFIDRQWKVDEFGTDQDSIWIGFDSLVLENSTFVNGFVSTMELFSNATDLYMVVKSNDDVNDAADANDNNLSFGYTVHKMELDPLDGFYKVKYNFQHNDIFTFAQILSTPVMRGGKRFILERVYEPSLKVED